MPHSSTPHRRWRGGVLALLVSLSLALSMVVVAGVGASAKPKDPSQDLPVIPKRCSTGATYLNADIRPCQANRWRPGRPTLVLWGDSHALQMLPAVQKAVAGRKVNLAMLALGSCPPMKYDAARAGCAGFNADALDYVTDLRRRGTPVRVILGGFWEGYRTLHRQLFVDRTEKRSDYPDFVVQAARVFPTRAPALLRRLGRMGIDVDVIGQTATVPTTGLRRCRAGETPFVCTLPRRKALPHETATSRWLRSVMSPLTSRSRLIDPNSAYCNARVCQGRRNGIHTFFNDLHISATRAGTMKRYFLPAVRALKRQR